MRDGGGCSVNNFMGSLLLLIVLFVGSTFLIQSNDASTINLLGVAPEDISYYRRGSIIPCKDGHGSFPLERLNDDFCDCLDGTDEPGTSACPSGRFYCYNLQHKPSWIFSSRVNDGICDCCDGSDEYNKKTKCSVTCPEVIPLARELESILSEDAMVQVTTSKWKAEVNTLRDMVYKLRDLKILMMLELALVMLLCWQFYGWSRGRSSISRRRLKLPR